MIIWTRTDTNTIPPFRWKASWFSSRSSRFEIAVERVLNVKARHSAWFLDHEPAGSQLSIFVHMLLHIMIIAHCRAGSPECHAVRTFSLVIPDWVLPPACLVILACVVSAHRRERILELASFGQPIETLIGFEITTMSSYMARKENEHVLSQQELWHWQRHPAHSVYRPTAREFVDWIQPARWLLTDEDGARVRQHAHRWFPSKEHLLALIRWKCAKM